jgi:biopolymer transport protein ExbD
MSLLVNRRRKTEINIVPLVDVLTVLIFFFLMTTQFRQDDVLNITVPEMQTAGQSRVQDPIVIAVTAEGELFFNDQAISWEALEAALAVAGGIDSQQSILLVADEESALRHVTRVMDIARTHRLNRIRLRAR